MRLLTTVFNEQGAAEEDNSQLRQNLFQATQAHDIAADDLQVATQDIRALHGQVDDLSHENQGLHSRAAGLQRELISYQRKFTQAEVSCAWATLKTFLHLRAWAQMLAAVLTDTRDTTLD